RSDRTEAEKRTRRDERIARLRRVKQRAAQQHDSWLAVQSLDERLRRVVRDSFFNQRAHAWNAVGPSACLRSVKHATIAWTTHLAHLDTAPTLRRLSERGS